MKRLSAFDIGMIIAFVVVALLGGAAWYYVSGQLAATQATVSSDDSDFNRYTGQEVFLPTGPNVATLQANIDLLHAQIDPIIHDMLQNPGNKLAAAASQDTDAVKWKQHLDGEVGKLSGAAKTHGVSIPQNFYFGFSRYLSANPANDQIVVLSKQLLGVVEIANIFINAPVRSIVVLRRTAEEETASTSNAPGLIKADSDILPGHSSMAPGDVYTAYPFEIEFDADTEALRKVTNGLLKSPYVFVIRFVTVQNDKTDSPQVADLDKLAGMDNSGVADAPPGSVGTNKSTLPPQYLFGHELLHVKMQLDLIEWNGVSNGETTGAGARNGARGARGGRGGGNGGRGGAGGGE